MTLGQSRGEITLRIALEPKLNGLIDKYIQWIQKPNSWGGAIELAILSSYFQVEIDSIDVQTGRIDKFGT